MCAQGGTRHRAAQNAQGKQPQMNTDSNGKPDLTRESSTEEGPGGGEEGTKARSSEPGRVAPVHVRNGLAVHCASDDIWCAGANRVDTTRLAGVARLPAAEHSAGAFLFRMAPSRSEAVAIFGLPVQVNRG